MNATTGLEPPEKETMKTTTPAGSKGAPKPKSVVLRSGGTSRRGSTSVPPSLLLIGYLP